MKRLSRRTHSLRLLSPSPYSSSLSPYASYATVFGRTKDRMLRSLTRLSHPIRANSWSCRGHWLTLHVPRCNWWTHKALSKWTTSSSMTISAASQARCLRTTSNQPNCLSWKMMPFPFWFMIRLSCSRLANLSNVWGCKRKILTAQCQSCNTRLCSNNLFRPRAPA